MLLQNNKKGGIFILIILLVLLFTTVYIRVATHGPGCRGGSFTGTVHLTHPIDGDTMAVARSDILGIAKPEVIAHLYYQYGLSLDEEIDMEAIKDEDMSL